MDNGKIQQICNIYPDVEGFRNRTSGRVYAIDGLAPTINTCQGGGREPKIMETDKTICLNSKVNGKQPSLQDRVYDVAGCSTAITTSFLPSIAKPAILRKYRSEEQRENRRKTKGQDEYFAGREMRPVADGVSNTLTSVQKDNLLAEPTYRIRKLTPRECFRLMSVSEENIDKIQAAGISNSQQYKLAGNSIDVNVLKAIFRQLFKFNLTQQTY